MFRSFSEGIFHKNLLGISLFFMACLFVGCDPEEEQIPAFLHIEPFEVEANPAVAHGSISQKITNARISLIDKETGKSNLIGTVSLPATVPALVSGEVEAIVDPIIKANGNSLYLEIYPFYKRYTTTLTLSPNVESTISPKTTYVDNAVFVFIEDFEGAGHLFEDDRDENVNTYIEISEEEAFEGNSGKIELDSANSVIVAATPIYQFDPTEAGKIFMEVNYKTDVPIEFGVLAVDGQGFESANFEFVVLPREDWNKIYFDLTDLLTTSRQSRFVFALRAGIPRENGKLTMTNAQIFLDNIKLIHF